MGIHDLLLVVLTVVTWAAAAPTKNWTDISGRFSVDAEMVGFQDGLVHLKRVDGKVVKVPLERLSPADQDFVRRSAASAAPPAEAAAAGEQVIRLPFSWGMFERSVSIDAIDAAGTGQATASRQPLAATPTIAIPPLTEGFYIGLVGLPLSSDPIGKVARGAAILDGLRVACVEVVAIHEGEKMVFRVAPEVGVQLRKGESMTLLRLSICSTAHLRSVVGLISVNDARADSLGLTAEMLSQLERSAENLRRMGQAMHRFHEQHGHFPPAIVYGPDGKPWHSWRVLILPHLGQQALYDQYRLDEPWDGPHNRQLSVSVPDVYRDPIHDPSQDSYTHYAVVVGPVVAFADEPRRPLAFLSQPAGLTGATCGLRNCTDGTSNTIFIGSISPQRQIPWTKPEDLVWRYDFPPLGAADGFAAPYRARDRAGGMFGFVDGSACCISAEIDIQVFRHLLQMNDGRAIRHIPKLTPGSDWGSASAAVLEIPRGRAGAKARIIVEPAER